MMITISGAAINLQPGSLSIDDRIGERTVADFVVLDDTLLAEYVRGMPVVVNDGVNDIFAGVVMDCRKRIVGSRNLAVHQVSCVDYHYAADKRLAAKSYENLSAGVIASDLAEEYLAEEGIQKGSTAPAWTDFIGPEIEEVVFNYVPVSQALDSLAERANAVWYINSDMEFIFESVGDTAAPFVADGDNLLANSIILQDSNHKYRNVQVVQGVKEKTAPQTETQTGDGEKQSFTVGYPLAIAPLAIDISTDGGMNWTPQTWGIKGLEEGKQWYWAVSDNTIVQDFNDAALADGHLIRIEYQGEFPVILISLEPAAILDQQTIEGIGTGRVEAVTSTSGQNSIEGGLQVTSSLLEKYAVQGKILTFVTLEPGLRAGQMLTVNLPEYLINGDEYLIEEVVTQDRGGNLIEYAVKAVIGPEQRSWAQLFAGMAREGEAAIRLGTGIVESIIYPYRFERDWLITDDPNIFDELFPSDTLDPSDTLPVCFDYEDRVRYMEIHDAGGAQLRKAITLQTGEDTDNIFSLTYLSGYEGSGLDITAIKWFGGVEATHVIGTGIEVDEQTTSTNMGAAPWTKETNQAWQVEKEDNKW